MQTDLIISAKNWAYLQYTGVHLLCNDYMESRGNDQTMKTEIRL